MITDDEAYKIAQAIVEMAKDAGHAAGAVTFWEAQVKIELARLKNMSNKKTAAEREDFALSQPEYLSAVETLAKAREKQQEYRTLQAGYSAQLDVWRTHAANVRGVR